MWLAPPKTATDERTSGVFIEIATLLQFFLASAANSLMKSFEDKKRYS